MLRHRLKLLFVLTLWVVLVLPTFVVKAEVVNPKIQLNSDRGVYDITSTVNTTSQKLCKFDFLTWNSSSKTLTINKSGYNSSSTSQANKQEIMKVALTSINRSNSLTHQDKTRIYNFIADQDTAVSSLVRQLTNDVNADFAGGYAMFRPFSGPIGDGLGFFTIALFVLFTASTLFDVGFLAVSTLQLILIREDGKRPKFISREAFSAHNLAEDTSKTRDVISIYFGKKTKQFIIVGLCLMYLASGKIYLLVGYIIDSFTGFIIQ